MVEVSVRRQTNGHSAMPRGGMRRHQNCCILCAAMYKQNKHDDGQNRTQTWGKLKINKIKVKLNTQQALIITARNSAKKGMTWLKVNSIRAHLGLDQQLTG